MSYLKTFNLSEPPQDIFINEKNLILSPQQRELVQNKMEALLNMAPAYSIAQVDLSKKRRFFFAHLDIHAFNHRFSAKTHSKFLPEILQQLEKEMSQQFTLWRSTRFAQPAVVHAS